MIKYIPLSIILSSILLILSCKKQEPQFKEDINETGIVILPDTNGLPKEVGYFIYKEDENENDTVTTITKSKDWFFAKENSNGSIDVEEKLFFRFSNDSHFATDDSLICSLIFKKHEENKNLFTFNDQQKLNYKDQEIKFQNFCRNPSISILVNPCHIVHESNYNIKSVRRVFHNGEQFTEIHFTIEGKFYHPDGWSGQGYTGKKPLETLGGDSYHVNGKVTKGDFTVLLL